MTRRSFRYASLVAFAVLIIAGCGGKSAATPDQQIRAVTNKVFEALVSDHPEGACKYSTQEAACLQGVVMAKAMKIDLKSLIPEDWRARVAQAHVTVAGDRATMSEVLRGAGTSTFVHQGGQWLMEVSVGSRSP